MSTVEGSPLVDQYLVRILPTIAVIAPGAHSGSAAFRRALRVISEDTGLLPTRSETAAAMRRLARQGQIGGIKP